MASAKNSKQGTDRMATADPTNQSAFITRSKKEEDKQHARITQRLRDDILRMRQEELIPDMQFLNGSHTFPGHKLIIKSRAQNAVHEDWFHISPGVLPTLLLNHKSPEESKQFLDTLYTSEELDVAYIIQGIKTEDRTPPKTTAADADLTSTQDSASENITKDIKQQEPDSPSSEPADSSADANTIPQASDIVRGDECISQASTSTTHDDLASGSSSENTPCNNAVCAKLASGLKLDEQQSGFEDEESVKQEETTHQSKASSCMVDLNESASESGASNPETHSSATPDTDSVPACPSDGGAEAGDGVSVEARDQAGSSPENGSLAAPCSDTEAGGTSGDWSEGGIVFRPCGSLASDLLRSYQSGDLTDCCLKVNGHKFMAHRCILAARCYYFSAMFAGAWSESEEMEIELHNVTAQAVKYILLFLYGAMPEVPVADITAVIQASDMYGVEGLKEWLCFHITRDYCHFFHKPCQKCTAMVPDILVLASQFNLTELSDRANRWMATHFRRIWEMPTFNTLPAPLLEECINTVVDQLSVQNIAQIILDVHDLARTLQRNHRAEQVQVAAVRVLYKALTFCAQHFPALVTSPSFLSWSRGGAWCLDLLMENYTVVVSILQPDAACEVYGSLRQQLAVSEAETGDEGSFGRSEEALELLRKLVKRCEWYFHRYIHGVIQCPKWSQLPRDLQDELLQKSSFVPVSAATTVGAQSRAAQKSAKALQDNIEHTVNMLCETDPSLFPSLSLVRKILPNTAQQQKPKRPEASSKAAVTASNQGGRGKGTSKSVGVSGNVTKGKATSAAKSTVKQAAARPGPAGSPRASSRTTSTASQRPTSGKEDGRVGGGASARGGATQGKNVTRPDAGAAKAGSSKSSSVPESKGTAASARPSSAKNSSRQQGKSTSASARPDSARSRSSQQGKTTSAPARPDSARNSPASHGKSTSAPGRPGSAKNSSTPQGKSTAASARLDAAKNVSTPQGKSTSASSRPNSARSLTPSLQGSPDGSSGARAKTPTASAKLPSSPSPASGPSSQTTKLKATSSATSRQSTAVVKAIKESSMETEKGISAEPAAAKPGSATSKGAREKLTRKFGAAAPKTSSSARPSSAKSIATTDSGDSTSRHRPTPSSPKVTAARGPVSGTASEFLVNKSTPVQKKPSPTEAASVNTPGRAARTADSSSAVSKPGKAGRPSPAKTSAADQSTGVSKSSNGGKPVEHSTQTRISYTEKHEKNPSSDQDTHSVSDETPTSNTVDTVDDSSETIQGGNGNEASCDGDSSQPPSQLSVMQQINAEENATSAPPSANRTEKEEATSSAAVVSGELTAAEEGMQHAVSDFTATVDEPHAPASITEQTGDGEMNSQDTKPDHIPCSSTEENMIIPSSVESQPSNNTSSCQELAVSGDLDTDAKEREEEKAVSPSDSSESSGLTSVSGSDDVGNRSTAQEKSEEVPVTAVETPVPTIIVQSASSVEEEENISNLNVGTMSDNEDDDSSFVVITPETSDDNTKPAAPEKSVVTEEARDTSFPANTPDTECQDNTADTECQDDIAGTECQDDIAGTECQDDIAGTECQDDIAGTECQDNIADTECQDNIADTECQDNIADTECQDNIADTECQDNTADTECQDNTADTECQDNTADTERQDNIADTECQDNTTDTECQDNTADTKCQDSTADTERQDSTADTECQDDIAGTECQDDIAGTECQDDIAGTECQDDIAGTECQDNIADTECQDNIADTECQDNTADTECQDNTADTECQDNTADTECQDNTADTERQDNIADTECQDNTADTECQDNTADTKCQDSTADTERQDSTADTECQDDIAGTECQDDIAGTECQDDIAGTECQDDIAGTECQDNIADTECQDNIADTECQDNIADTECQDNTADTECQDNTADTECQDNTADTECQDNIADTECQDNTADTECQDNTADTERQDSTADTERQDSTADTECQDNTADTECQDNTTDTECQDNTAVTERQDNTADTECQDSTAVTECQDNTAVTECQDNNSTAMDPEKSNITARAEHFSAPTNITESKTEGSVCGPGKLEDSKLHSLSQKVPDVDRETITADSRQVRNTEAGHDPIPGQESSQQLIAADEKGDGNTVKSGQGDCTLSGRDGEVPEMLD